MGRRHLMNRRQFFKTTSLGGFLAGFLGLDLSSGRAWAQAATPQRGRITTTICPYCGVGCSALVTAVDGRITSIEGDPDHPVNEGALCSKGSAMLQLANAERRITKVKYRAPGSSEWEERDWQWAIRTIAERIKATRDATFVERDDAGRVVNRTEGIACMGGAALDNEECYLYSKMARAFGAVFIEHQARI